MRNLLAFPSLLLAFIVTLISGCSSENKPAPEPVSNPDAHLKTHLIVKTEDPNVDDIQVVSVWLIGDLHCAPINYPEGYINAKQINVHEEVQYKEGSYVASILRDRYAQDSCKWMWGSAQVNFMHEGKIYSIFQVPSDDSAGSTNYKIECIPTGRFLGICDKNGGLTAQQRRSKNIFEATIEEKP